MYKEDRRRRHIYRKVIWLARKFAPLVQAIVQYVLTRRS